MTFSQRLPRMLPVGMRPSEALNQGQTPSTLPLYTEECSTSWASCGDSYSRVAPNARVCATHELSRRQRYFYRCPLAPLACVQVAESFCRGTQTAVVALRARTHVGNTLEKAKPRRRAPPGAICHSRRKLQGPGRPHIFSGLFTGRVKPRGSGSDKGDPTRESLKTSGPDPTRPDL